LGIVNREFRVLSVPATCRAAACAVGFCLAWHLPTAAQQDAGPPARTPTATPTDYATAHDLRQLQVTRARGAIRLDGVLDDETWVEAPMAHDFSQNDLIDRAVVAKMTYLVAF
jgi:hypothetical protein